MITIAILFEAIARVINAIAILKITLAKVANTLFG
jgi:hypothetical protein